MRRKNSGTYRGLKIFSRYLYPRGFILPAFILPCFIKKVVAILVTEIVFVYRTADNERRKKEFLEPNDVTVVFSDILKKMEGHRYDNKFILFAFTAFVV